MDREEELRETAKAMLPDAIISIAYVEHQMDLIGSLVKDLFTLVDPDKITEDIQQKLDVLAGALQYSSIDFNSMDDPLQAYKLPLMIEKKAETRIVQTKYLQKKLQEGIL
ncbi:hypothetical protein [Paenibacillus radicis (ex Xue et al. 2023)]|uniref:Uncharacterized protein n=1 Tax=Paenibacillus radicis (ex Xue et al. 2023) TaxID=2972489 RepID=A0ABT1YJY9_9BACL|nr:hypothetical protein [Paenibacillus radicis (ex Xue et al. 2023)]MCR8633499.1 hypothetical protein [Paenibacillus radicis (ex Xue et al. 2023)]